MNASFSKIEICSNCGLRPVHHNTLQQPGYFQYVCMKPEGVERTLNELTRQKVEWLKENKYLYEQVSK